MIFIVKDKHLNFLNLAHKLARTKVGLTYPNPVVGCLIVKNNKIISKGITASSGRPHAEEIALKKAGKKTKGSTMYVTLEPCFHNSHNGSCVEQILRSGIKSIYIARHDPDPRTNKKSVQKLKKSGLYVDLGQTKNNTNLINNFFFTSLKNKRPFVKVKMAISKDEKIAWSDYSSKWISNQHSRNFAHKLRFQSQAILTTSKTIIKDNPRLTVRSKNKVVKYPTIIIIDKSLKIPLKNCNLINSLTKRRIIIFTSKSGKKFHKLKSLGCEIFLIKKQKKSDEFNLKLIMKKILSLKINNIMVEAGGIFFTKLLENKLIDEIHIFKAPFNIGKTGKPMIIDKKITDLPIKEISKNNFGKDVYHQLIFR